MATPGNPSAFNARIEALTQALEASSDTEAQQHARDLVTAVLEFHGAALQRMLALLEGNRQTLAPRFAADPLVAGLLELHELLPAAPDAVGGRSSALRPQPPLIQITRRWSPIAPAAPEAHREQGSVCDRCGEPLPDVHHHHVDLATRRLSCSCRACWLLSSADPGWVSTRAVPDRYLRGPDLRLQPAQWEALQIPVAIAFFMFNSAIGRTIAFYPSPAGATESALSLGAWRDIEAANPWVRSLEPDVEALLVRTTREAADVHAAFIVPIDACYDLVGRIRRHWTGFDGGEEVRAEIDRFFAGIAARSIGPTAVRS